MRRATMVMSAAIAVLVTTGAPTSVDACSCSSALSSRFLVPADVVPSYSDGIPYGPVTRDGLPGANSPEHVGAPDPFHPEFVLLEGDEERPIDYEVRVEPILATRHDTYYTLLIVPLESWQIGARYRLTDEPGADRPATVEFRVVEAREPTGELRVEASDVVEWPRFFHLAPDCSPKRAWTDGERLRAGVHDVPDDHIFFLWREDGSYRRDYGRCGGYPASHAERLFLKGCRQAPSRIEVDLIAFVPGGPSWRAHRTVDVGSCTPIGRTVDLRIAACVVAMLLTGLLLGGGVWFWRRRQGANTSSSTS